MSPNLGFFYIDATIDGFTESGAGGLNLIYDEQKFKSLTGNARPAHSRTRGTCRGAYCCRTCASTTCASSRTTSTCSACASPPIRTRRARRRSWSQTDNPDESYWRLAGGFSAQFKYGISGYIEYQRLESFEFISFQDVSIGLRFQRSF